MGNGDEQFDEREPASPVSAAVSRALKGKAERLFYEQYRDSLYAYVYARVRHHAAAEEIMQKAFMQYMKVPRPEVESQKAFLFTIALRLIFKHSQKCMRENVVQTDIDSDSLSSSEIRRAPVESITEVEHEIDLERAVHMLPEHLRYVFALSQQGMSGTEIAKECDVSLATVYRRLLDARNLLAISLGWEPPRKERK